jgi:hypothetical protein
MRNDHGPVSEPLPRIRDHRRPAKPRFATVGD